MSAASRFIVGIDLGTTNTAVAYIDTRESDRPQPFAVPQIVEAGEVAAGDVLPSFCYIPAETELSGGTLQLPWKRQRKQVVGVFARNHGAAVPGRMVASAKSWLAHGGVDRTSPILPWGSDIGEEQQLSPVEVSRCYIEHIRHAWNHRFGDLTDDDGTPCLLEHQDVVLTVPASFDEVARELTVQAARQAGLDRITLLEEPLAAFYAWLLQHESDWNDTLREQEKVLVVDIGGGTTDFSLVDLEQGGTLRRTAVGDHLLLGGDNIDMALAREAEQAWGRKLGPREWSLLCQEGRRAKEKILTEEDSDAVTLSITGAGSSVVAGTQSCELRRDKILDILLNGFFPAVPKESPPPARRRGMRELGLPYVSDPAVTRHLLVFLRRAAGGDGKDPQAPVLIPDRILFNGGSMLPRLIRGRIAETIGSWGEGKAPVQELQSADLNLAVGRGAAYYGRVRRGKGVRVRGGIARSYYLEVQSRETDELLCVMPRETEEGEAVQLSAHQFQAVTNRPVRFPLFSSSTRLHDRAGDVLTEREEMTELPPLQTVLSYGRQSQHRRINVEVAAVLNEVGTLDIWCMTPDGHQRYPLKFDLRGRGAAESETAAEPELVLPQEIMDRARDLLRETFAGDGTLHSLTSRLEDELEVQRRDWGLTLLRSLADVLLEMTDTRRKSADFEARWHNLAGFCLRPGFGTPADEWRIREVWKLWHAGPSHARRPQVGAEWWTFWRRIAGGLRPGQQQQIRNTLRSELLPKGGRLGPRKANPQVAREMWRCYGALERLSVKEKVRVLHALLDSEASLQPHHYWVIARLGARRLFHGPSNAVIPAQRLEPLLDTFFARVGRRKVVRAMLLAAASMCRLTGIRGLDVEAAYRRRAAELLECHGAPAEWQRQLDTVQAESRDYQAEVVGDALPLGLVLHTQSPENSESSHAD